MPAWSIADAPSQRGRVAIVTGGNSGVGWEAALGLSRAGSEVILTVRDRSKGEDALDRIRRIVPAANVRYEILDLADLESVREFTLRMAGLRGLSLLVNNAGLGNLPERETTRDGFEQHFGTNFLGPFALTRGLLPTLQRSSSSRVVTVCSLAADLGLRRIRFEDPNWSSGYNGRQAYSQSKLADLMFALELANRLERAGSAVKSVACHPGVARTNIQKGGKGKPVNPVIRFFLRIFAQDAATGALPTLRAATDPSARSGTYYGPSGRDGSKGPPIVVAIPPSAQDRTARERLWVLAEELTRGKFDVGAVQLPGSRPQSTG